MDAKQIEATVKQVLPLASFMDVEVLTASEGEYRCKVPLNEKTKNHFNSIHAAIQWAGAELLGGLVWIRNYPGDGFNLVLKEMNIRFLKPAMDDVEACAKFNEAQVNAMKSELKENGRHDFQLAAEITDKEGTVLAETTGCYAIRKLK